MKKAQPGTDLKLSKALKQDKRVIEETKKKVKDKNSAFVHKPL